MFFKNRIFWFFLLLVLVQWYVPGNMILEQEDILKTGKAFKFKTAPIDPADPFRGRYVALGFDQNQFETTSDPDWDYEHDNDRDIFVHLGVDSDGFAKVIDVSREKPSSSIDYVKAKCSAFYKGEKDESILINLDYPFNPFYMEEFKAPAAEKIYREAQIDSNQVAFALVKIKDGSAVIEQVMVDNMPIGDWVAKQGH